MAIRYCDAVGGDDPYFFPQIASFIPAKMALFLKASAIELCIKYKI
jgi:hypothetical protein